MKKITILLAAAVVLIACSKSPKTGQEAAGSTSTVQTDTIKTITETPKAVAADSLLVPGQSAGKISINTDANEAMALLGKPDAGDSAMQKSVAIWYKDHDPKSYVTAIYSMRSTTTENPPLVIQQVRVTSPGFMTQEGVGITSSLETIKSKYSLSQLDNIEAGGKKYAMYDSTKGISFEIDDKGVCTAVIIHKGGEALKGTYLDIR